jgi:hypothetical protein
MVLRGVARRVYPDRGRSWAERLTHVPWDALRPALRADRGLRRGAGGVRRRADGGGEPLAQAAARDWPFVRRMLRIGYLDQVICDYYPSCQAAPEAG